MSVTPTYTLHELQELIPMASLEELKAITRTVKAEKGLFDVFTRSKILLMISKRTLELARNRG